MMVEIKIVEFNQQYAPVISKIRHAVFTIEQKIDGNKGLDGRDPGAVHILVKVGEEYIGTGRMLADGHIGRLAVLKSFRGQSMGTKIIVAFMEEAKKCRIKTLFLGAQKQAIPFYHKAGFIEYGEPYYEVGIEHIHMKCKL